MTEQGWAPATDDGHARGKVIALAAVVALLGGAAAFVFMGGGDTADQVVAQSPSPSPSPSVTYIDTAEGPFTEDELMARMHRELVDIDALVEEWRYNYTDRGWPMMLGGEGALYIARGVVVIDVSAARITEFGTIDNRCIQSVYQPIGRSGDHRIATSISWSEADGSVSHIGEICPDAFSGLGWAQAGGVQIAQPILEADFLPVPFNCITRWPSPEPDGEANDELLFYVPCRGDHHFEIVGTGFVPGDEYPGEGELEEYVGDECMAALREYVGQDNRYDASLSYTYSTEERWDQGYRMYGCFVEKSAGATGSISTILNSL